MLQCLTPFITAFAFEIVGLRILLVSALMRRSLLCLGRPAEGVAVSTCLC